VQQRLQPPHGEHGVHAQLAAGQRRHQLVSALQVCRVQPQLQRDLVFSGEQTLVV
jgi:hypothetical protein